MSVELVKKEEVATLEAEERPVVSTLEAEKNDQEFATEILSKIENEINSETSSQAELQKIDGAVKLANPETRERIKNELNLENKLGDLDNEVKVSGEEVKSKISEVLETKEFGQIDVESQANSKENPSLLLFSRINNPVIESQIVDLLKRNEKYLVDTEDEVIFYDEKGEFVEKGDGTLVMKKVPSTHKPKTETELKEILKKRILEVSTDTPISYDKEMPVGNAMEGARENISLYFEIQQGTPLTNLEKSIIEGHEKGHVLRPYDTKFFTKYFSEGFDISAIDYTNEDLEQVKIHSGENEITLDDVRESINYYLSDGREIAERMSQLKNYFGFKGAEKFTKTHLDYAREHYSKDTGLDNNMRHFFKGITKEKEGGFIRLINSSGI